MRYFVKDGVLHMDVSPGCIFVRQSPDYYSGYRRIQIVKDEFIGKPMPIIKPPRLPTPSVEETKLKNTRELISKFFAKNPQKQSEYLKYYSHFKTHDTPEVRLFSFKYRYLLINFN